MVKVLELFSGTHSVGKVCKELGYEVLSLDVDGKADINMDIMDWDYTQYPEGYFDLIWSSFPCTTFSNARRCWIGRKTKYFGNNIITEEMLREDEIENGVPLIRKSEEIIDYFKPIYYFMENPATGRAKHYINKPSYIVDYCAYGHECKKPTMIWTNKTDWKPKRCSCKNHKLWKDVGSGNNLARRYVIPPLLIKDLILINDI